MSIFDMLLANALGESGGGGGGGSSDFVKAHITLNISSGYTGSYRIHCVDAPTNWDYRTAFVIDNEYGVTVEPDEINVAYGIPKDIDVYIVSGKAFVIEDNNGNATTYDVSGNAENISYEDGGYTYYMVRVTGDCTISMVGIDM